MSEDPASVSASVSASVRHVRVKTGLDGRLTWVAAWLAADGLSSAWTSMTTSRRRDVLFFRGEVVHDGSADPVDQTVSLALMTIAAAEIEQADKPVGSARNPQHGKVGSSVLTGLARDLAETENDAATARFVRACGTATLRAALSGRDPGSLRALDAVCGAEKVDAFFDKWPFLFFSALARLSMASSVQADAKTVAVIQAEEADVARVATDAFVIRRDEWSAEDEMAHRTAMRHLLKRLRNVEPVAPVDATAMLWLAGQAPVDWLPSDGQEAVSFSRAAALLRAVAKTSLWELSAATLASSSKGRWSEFMDRIRGSTTASDAVEQVPRAVADMVQAFRNQVAGPALRHHLTFAGREARVDEPLRQALPKAMRAVDSTTFRNLDRTCFRILFGSKSLPAIVEAQEAWHRAREAMDLAIGVGDNVSWPVPFARVDMADGISLVPVGDAFTLKHEGAALRHCVGGYVDRCISRRSVVVSVRRRLADGTEERSSTIELSRWNPGEVWEPKVLQHKGILNSAPPAADVAALAAFVGDWIAARRKADGEPLPAAAPVDGHADTWVVDDDVEAVFAYPGFQRRGRVRPAGGPEGRGGGGGLFEPLIINPPYGFHRGDDRPVPPATDGRPEMRRAAVRNRGMFVIDRIRSNDARGGGDADVVSVAAGYDWMDVERLDNAFAQWRRFLPADVAERGPVGFMAYLDEIVDGEGAADDLRAAVALAHDHAGAGRAASWPAGRRVIGMLSLIHI